MIVLMDGWRIRNGEYMRTLRSFLKESAENDHTLFGPVAQLG